MGLNSDELNLLPRRKYNALITAPKSKPSQNAGPGRPRGSSNDPALAAKRRMLMKAPSGNRRRRVRCKNCDACLGGDCRICVYCKDMAKYVATPYQSPAF